MKNTTFLRDYSNVEDFSDFEDPSFQENLILGEGLYMTSDDSFLREQKLPERNKNVFILGASGSGKTRSIIKPNLMQMNCNYIVTDPKGELEKDLRRYAELSGKNVKTVDLVNFSEGCRYNPLRYLKDEVDIMRFSQIIANQVESSKDKFWGNATMLLLSACIAFLFDKHRILGREHPVPIQTRCGKNNPFDDEITISKMIELLDSAEVRDDNEAFISELDSMFEALNHVNPDCFAYKQYTKFKSAANNTMKSILISCHAALAPLQAPPVRERLSQDTLRIENFAGEPTVLFIRTSDTDSTYDFLLTILVNQIMQVLIDQADNELNGRLPIHQRFLFDEFANMEIQDIDRKISTIRSRNISMTVAVQSFGQIESRYNKATLKTMVSNCDSFIFLGTQDTYDRNQVKAMIAPISDPDLYSIGIDDSIVIVRGLPAFKVKKYNVKSHPRYLETEEARILLKQER